MSQSSSSSHARPLTILVTGATAGIGRATALSLAYYLNVVRALYMRSGEVAPGTVVAAGGSPPRDLLLDTAVAAGIVVTIGSFFFVQPLVDAARDAAASLPL